MNDFIFHNPGKSEIACRKAIVRRKGLNGGWNRFDEGTAKG